MDEDTNAVVRAEQMLCSTAEGMFRQQESDLRTLETSQCKPNALASATRHDLQEPNII